MVCLKRNLQKSQICVSDKRGRGLSETQIRKRSEIAFQTNHVCLKRKLSETLPYLTFNISGWSVIAETLISAPHNWLKRGLKYVVMLQVPQRRFDGRRIRRFLRRWRHRRFCKESREQVLQVRRGRQQLKAIPSPTITFDRTFKFNLNIYTLRCIFIPSNIMKLWLIDFLD